MWGGIRSELVVYFIRYVVNPKCSSRATSLYVDTRWIIHLAATLE